MCQKRTDLAPAPATTYLMVSIRLSTQKKDHRAKDFMNIAGAVNLLQEKRFSSLTVIERERERREMGRNRKALSPDCLLLKIAPAVL